MNFNISDAQDLLEALQLISYEHDLRAISVQVNRDDHVRGLLAEEATFTDGSKVFNLHLLI